MPVASGEIEVSYDKVVGVGVPKTGTTTLGACFRVLRIDPHQGHPLGLVERGSLTELHAPTAVDQSGGIALLEAHSDGNPNRGRGVANDE